MVSLWTSNAQQYLTSNKCSHEVHYKWSRWHCGLKQPPEISGLCLFSCCPEVISKTSEGAFAVWWLWYQSSERAAAVAPADVLDVFCSLLKPRARWLLLCFDGDQVHVRSWEIAQVCNVCTDSVMLTVRFKPLNLQKTKLIITSACHPVECVVCVYVCIYVYYI